ncbi:MAG: OmpA family protein [Rickettsiales bacterium]|nr:OmpA family protein [Rickettsiales bacterium]
MELPSWLKKAFGSQEVATMETSNLNATPTSDNKLTALHNKKETAPPVPNNRRHGGDHTPHHSDHIPDKFPLNDRDIVRENGKITTFKHYDKPPKPREREYYSGLRINLGRKVPIGPVLEPPPAPLPAPAGIYQGNTALYYDNNKTDIKPKGQNTLREVAEYLKNNSGAFVLLHSQTDRRGGADTNQILSEGRTTAAYAELIKHMQDLGIENPEQQAKFSHASTGESQVTDPDGTANEKKRNTQISITPSPEAQKAYEAVMAQNAAAKAKWEEGYAEYKQKTQAAEDERSLMTEVEHNILVDNNSPQEFTISPALSDASTALLKENEGIQSGYGSVLLSEDLAQPVTIHFTNTDLYGTPDQVADNIRFLVKTKTAGTEVTFVGGDEPNIIKAQIRQNGTTRTLGVIHLPKGVSPDKVIFGIRDRDGNVQKTELDQSIDIAAVEQGQGAGVYGGLLDGRVNLQQMREETQVMSVEVVATDRTTLPSTEVPAQQRLTDPTLTVG